MTEARAVHGTPLDRPPAALPRSSSSSSTPRSSTSPCRRSARLDFSQENSSGRQRLRADLRRLPAPGRAHGRPAGAGGCSSPGSCSSRWLPRGGFAATEGQLIARAAQVSAAAIIVRALSIITTTFSDGAERNKALAWERSPERAAPPECCSCILTDGLGWEWVPWINVPIALAVAALPDGPEDPLESATRHFDAGRGQRDRRPLGARLRARRRDRRRGWLDPDAKLALALSAALIAAFVAIELVGRAVDAVPDLPIAHIDRRQHRRAPRRGIAVLDVLHHAVHAAGPRLQRDQGRGCRTSRSRSRSSPRPRSRPSSPGSGSSRSSRRGWRSSPADWCGSPRSPSIAASRPTSSGRAARGGGARIRVRDDDDRRRLGRPRAGVRARGSGLINTSQQIGGALGPRCWRRSPTRERTTHCERRRRSRRAPERAHGGFQAAFSAAPRSQPWGWFSPWSSSGLATAARTSSSAPRRSSPPRLEDALRGPASAG